MFDVLKQYVFENFNDDGDLVDNARDKLTEYIDESEKPRG